MGAFIVTFPRDRIRTLVFFLIFFRVTYIPAALLIGFWFLMQVLNFGIVAKSAPAESPTSPTSPDSSSALLPAASSEPRVVLRSGMFE